MAHIRTQIRQRFKAVLDAALPLADYAVFSSRHYAKNHDPTKALVDMRFLNDQTSEIETMSDDRVHVASLYVRVQRSEDEADLDDALDADEVAVVTAIMSATWDDLLEDEPELLQANFADDAQGRALGAIVLRFDVEYRIDKTDPQTRVT